MASVSTSTVACQATTQDQSTASAMHTQDQGAMHQVLHAQHKALKAQHKALHAQHAALSVPQPLHPREKSGWASEGPHDVRRSPIPEESEDPLDRPVPHHEDSNDTIRANSPRRPPLARETGVSLPPPLLHYDSGDTIRAEPIGQGDRESRSAESRETAAPGHHQHHHHLRRKRGHSQPKPLMPPRRSTAGSKAAPGDACEVRTSAINVPKIMEHLCEVQVADVALVNSITALDGKVDRLLQHFGVQVGSAVGIHGKVDALIAALHVGENRE